MIRTIDQIEFVVSGPSRYVSKAIPSVSIQFDGASWVLSDGRVSMRFASLVAAVKKLRDAADYAIINIRRTHYAGPEHLR